jgi:hypothetical protein
MHLGFPKTGTTWVYDQLIKHKYIDYRDIKENYYLVKTGYPIKPYIDFYKSYNISLNFCPSTWTCDSKVLNELDSFTTHYSISFRNPYELINSIYNFMHQNGKSVTDARAIDLLDVNLRDYTKTIQRLQHSIKKDILILYYDDLCNNPQEYINTILDFLHLPKIVTVDSAIINPTNYRLSYKFNKDEIFKLNKMILDTSDYLNKDLTHWLR